MENTLRKKSLLTRWINFHDSKQQQYGVVFLFLISMAFVLSDWMLHYFSFAEILLMGTLPLMFVVGQVRISREQLKYFLLCGGALMIVMFIQGFMNNGYFNLMLVIQSAIKLLFYIVTFTILLNYIKRNQLQKSFLYVNNGLAIIVLIIGLYIMFSIYHRHEYPYRFLWTFTRDDYRSYYFSGNSDFIRMRSIFSEPAHLGYYLTTLITSNLLIKQSVKGKVIIVSLLSIGVFLTFSYSMVFTLIFVLFVYFLSQVIKHNISWHWSYLIIPFIMIVLGLVFRSYIYETFISRTLDIVSGADGSAFNRLVESWSYIHPETWWIGNGMGHTPTITNNYAYMISELGVFGIIPFIGLTGILLNKSISFGLLFILLNFSRGGYLGPSLWFLILFALLYNEKDFLEKQNARRAPHESIEWV